MVAIFQFKIQATNFLYLILKVKAFLKSVKLYYKNKNKVFIKDKIL